jgi:hypothetical protein
MKSLEMNLIRDKTLLAGTGIVRILGFSDYDVFLENDRGSRVYRCKKLF